MVCILCVPDMIGRNRQAQDYGLYTLCTLHDGEKSSGSGLVIVQSVVMMPATGQDFSHFDARPGNSTLGAVRQVDPTILSDILTPQPATIPHPP